MPNPLITLQRLGQSPWHDNIHRDLITSGQLARMIAEGDITGLTSNPTIFEQAIAGGTAYDAAIRGFAAEGRSAEQIFDALAIADIRDAADLFRPVFERTGGSDGYVSIEVAPTLAQDTAGTLAEARRLWRAVDRKNLLVKIPATAAGLGAIQAATADGINVNVTLIFSLERYAAVMAAYIAGLRARADAGLRVDAVFSVASFFVSRVDTVVDRLLDQRIAAAPDAAPMFAELRGKAAIANAKLAYAACQRVFSGPEFSDLAALGARRQRPLWASTSSKNPTYADTYYVEALIGVDTVNTMPPATIAAYRDHGAPALRVAEGLDAAAETIGALAAVAIDFEAVLEQLAREGVASFSRSFASLLAVLVQRMATAGRIVRPR
ncbi:MAG: transaldolase [Gemmatimonadota bacterium]|nr:transaldolase [Gemmatimonadota bacterium]MDE3128663.1 transaldolase [Gemmatimonadota bacterium]